MNNLQRCEHCRYVGHMDHVHGKFKCPECKQIPLMGDCCQGEVFATPADPCEGEDVPN